jgi:adenylosuccinate synthase
VSFFPANLDVLAKVECVYETLPGWDDDITAVRTFTALPANARKYVELVESTIGVPVTMVGIGPDRSQIITRDAR